MLRDIVILEADTGDASELKVLERTLGYCVVVTQDCDLEHDFNNRKDVERKTTDKFLQSVLICPAYPAESLRQGTHLTDWSMTMQSFPSADWRKLISNNLSRYHFLQGMSALQVPELVVDFKHYFTVPREMFYRDLSDRYLATIEIVYRDHLSNRFAHYLSRVGLPDLSPA